MGILSLNDDALLLIFANIYGEDALNVSLSTKRLYGLASSRIAAVVQCSSPSQLRKLHRYLLSTLSGGTLRVRYLEQLIIDASTFDNPASVEDEPAFDEELPVGSWESLYSDFSQVHMLADILMQAENIRELALERFHPCVARDPRMGAAFQSLPHLVNFRLSTIGDSTLADVLLHAKSNALERVTLSYHTFDDFPLPAEPKSLPPLLLALAKFQKLHTVKLWNFTPTDHLPLDPPPPSLPSMRYLRLSQSSVQALDMVELCPNLSTLVFSLDDENADAIPSVGSRWRPLRRLMLGDLREADSISNRLSTVDHLQLISKVTLDTPRSFTQESSTTRLLGLLRVTSPVSLYLRLVAFRKENRLAIEMFWKEVPSTAPRLRSLELQLPFSFPPFDTDFSWLLSIPNVLQTVPLLVLRIVVPSTISPGWSAGYRYDKSMKDDARKLCRAREICRVRALAELPQLCIEAIPTLLYMAIGDTAPNMDLFDRSDVNDEELADVFQHGQGEGPIESEWDELRQLDCVRKQRWWKIEARESQRILVEISEDGGEEAQRLIEEPQYRAATQIDHALETLLL
ncbi:hypothetical protein C8Q80DRAFT_612332 [Daedaleopsis nitida]|nr:hypothetical protein C8Q80DRAFT_612332 [Daedaleopsis nitida]